MSRPTRPGLPALTICSLLAAIFLAPGMGYAAGLLAFKPGSIDHPLHLVAADFNQDGYDDLVIANFEAGVLYVLINQHDGTFLPQKNTPDQVGAADVIAPTGGPLFLATGDLDPGDVDGDREFDDVDNCPNVYNPVVAGVQPTACLTPTTDNTDGDLFPDYLDNCPFIANDGQEAETKEGLDGVCGTADDNIYLLGADHLCGTADDKPPNPKVGAVCSRSADLVIANISQGGGSTLGAVRVRVNDGAGGLLARSSQSGSSGVSQTVLADLNGDRRLDLVVSNSGSDALLFIPGGIGGEMGLVCLGGSNAGAECVADNQCPGGACKMREALLTAGVCSGGSGAGGICANNVSCPGGGVCRAALGICSGGTSPTRPCSASPDCPGGGICDVSKAACAGGTVPGKACSKDTDCPGSICRTPAGPEGTAVADFDGDDRPDLIFANRTIANLGVLLNSGAAVFTPQAASPVTTQAQPAVVLVGAGPRVCMGGPLPGAVCGLDSDCGAGGVCRGRSLNGDACADPVVLSQGLQTCVGGTSPGSSCKEEKDCGAGGVCVGHGRIEVFTAVCPSGALTLPPSQTIDLGTGHVPRGGALVDFDRDGYLDLAVADFTGGQVLVYTGSATGQFTLAVTLTGLHQPSALAPLNFDHDPGPNLDLAILSYQDNNVVLYRNTGTPGNLSFALFPPAITPWDSVTAMSVFAADGNVGDDLVFLHDTPPNLDVLTGTGTTFRSLQAEPITGATGATALALGELRQDGIPDLLVLNGVSSGTATPLITDLLGAQTERVTVDAGNGPVQAVLAPLTLHAGDYDQDGVPDNLDNCPTRYNPPGCPANDKDGHKECFVDIPCSTLATALAGTVCTHQNAAGQCDNDQDGVGDQCEFLSVTCQNFDTDGDGVPDYDQLANPKRIDNCPWTPNSSQADSNAACSLTGTACTSDSDCGSSGGICRGIGDACDSGPCFLSSGECGPGRREHAACTKNGDCEATINDALIVDRAGGNLSFLIGDDSGALRQAPGTWTAVSGLANPVGAAVGRFSFDCIGGPAGFEKICTSQPEPEIMVVESGASGSGDDVLKLFDGDGLGGFTLSPLPRAQTPLQGDPTKLLVAPDQGVCANPWLLLSDPRYHFDKDDVSSVLAVVEPGTKSLGIYIPSDEGPAPPVAFPAPLPLDSPPIDASFVDLNQDGLLDLVALSSGDGNPATPNVTIYIGLGSGLFFTDPTINPTDVPDGMTMLAAGPVTPRFDFTYPDVVLFDGQNRAPVIMTNVLTERADIDRSGRVDGYDLALLTRSFGAERGEDFTIEPDGTLLQNPDLASSPAYDPARLVVGSGNPTEGQDLPSATGTPGLFFCDRSLQKLTGFYGLPVDINLDGMVEGKDLAILASLFGRSF